MWKNWEILHTEIIVYADLLSCILYSIEFSIFDECLCLYSYR